MIKELDLKQFKLVNCEIKATGEDDSSIVEIDKAGGGFLLEGNPLEIGHVDWKDKNYLVLEVKNLDEYIQGVTFGFWKTNNKTENPDMTIILGTIPGVKTTLSLPLSVLNAQKLFLPRTPGKLKSLVLGNKVDLSEVDRIGIGLMKSVKEQNIEFFNCYLSEDEPEYILPSIKLVDELGQNLNKEWTEKTKDEDELIKYLNNTAVETTQSFSENWSQYGGFKKKTFKASGYFRTEYDGNRWWLVDPEGCAFFSAGIDCVFPGESCRVNDLEQFFSWLPEKEGSFKDAWRRQEGVWSGDYLNFGIVNLIRAFGEGWKERWSSVTKRRLMKWGFNTIGNWSDFEFIKYSKLPYVYPLQDFPDTKKKIFRDFPDVFSEEYSINSETFACQLENFKDDEYLIGYFLRNEPQWAFINELNIAEELLENEEDFTSKNTLIEFLSHRYCANINLVNEAWGTEFKEFGDLKRKIIKAASLSETSNRDLTDFSKLMIERYVKLPSMACKKVDSNHLNLGMRYAFITSEALLAGSENFDVFSINCYTITPVKDIEEVGKLTKLPVMIGEYHFGALDRGLTSTGLRGVTSQEERGKAYKYYLENAATSSYCVGAHYFTLYDQALLGRFDGENMQIGCMDVCSRPYDDFLDQIQETNKAIYEVADGTKKCYSIFPKEIERVGF
jgi:hypothetical protein